MFELVREDYQRHGRSLRDRGFWALAVYRFGRWALELRPAALRWLAGKLYGALSLASEIVTGVTMDRRVRVGRRLLFIHPSGIYIHPDVVIGDDVAIMHNVTLGTNMGSDVPVVGNGVFLGTGASVLGRVQLGDGARVGANSLVINDVPPGAFAVGVPAKNLKGELSWREEAANAARQARGGS